VRGPEDDGNYTDHTTVAGHAAFPDAEGEERILKESVPGVEKNVAEAPAEKDAEDGEVHHKSGKFLNRNSEFVSFGENAQDQVGAEEAKQVGQSVPADGQRPPDVKNDRIEIVCPEFHSYRLDPLQWSFWRRTEK